MSESENTHINLIASQIKHTISSLQHDIELQKKTSESEIQYLRLRIDELERCKADFETRIRSLQESSTQFKLMAGLATGGGLVSIIILIRTISGG